jgi:hypothetical protein
MYSKILNPLTGRYVSICGKTGINILNTYLQASQKGGECLTTDKCQGAKKRCKKNDGCKYIKASEIESKRVDSYGCYKCDSSQGEHKSEEKKTTVEIDLSAPIFKPLQNDCEKIIQLWSTYSLRTKDRDMKNSGFLQDNKAVLTSVHKSGSAIENPYSGEQWLDTWEYSRKKNLSSERSEILSMYNVHSNILDKLSGNHVWIDQGDMGGCSFAALINLCQLGNITTPWSVSLSKMKNSREFKKLYERTYGLTDEGYRDWISALTAMCDRIPNFGKVLSKIKYQCFKTLRGNYHSLLIAEKTTSIEHYAEAVLDFIINLLHNGYVIAVPTISHFICIIGYNESGLLFLGSFGDKISTGGFHELREDLFTPIEIADSIMDCLYVKVR